MPNWCCGNIRFRGKWDDIIKLISETFEFCSYSGNGLETIQKPCKIETEEDYLIYVRSPFDEGSKSSWCYIKGTSRNFINIFGDPDFSSSAVCKLKEDKDDYIVVFENFCAAWSIEAEPYIDMSKRYNVDIRIMGWERGLGFWQDIVVVNGDVIRNIADDYGGYDGWMWDSAMPYLGG